MTTATASPAADLQPADPTTALLTTLWRSNGPASIAGLRRVIAEIDALLRRDVPRGQGEPWTCDPRSLLVARHGAIARAEWLEARSRGDAPVPFAGRDPSPSELLAQAKAALGFAAVERFVAAYRTAAMRRGAHIAEKLATVRAEIASRVGAYGSVRSLDGSWIRNENIYATMLEREAEHARDLDKIVLLPDAILARFRSSIGACIEAIGAEPLARGLIIARGQQEHNTVERQILEVRAIPTRIAAPEAWREVGALVLGRPDLFPAYCAARMLAATLDSLDDVDADVFVESVLAHL